MHEELYDIKVDVGEVHNLADAPLYATTVRELRVRATLRYSGGQSTSHAAASVHGLQDSFA